MAVKFEPYLNLQNYGFDQSVTPEWLMVALGKEKSVWLTDGDGLTVTSLFPGIASVAVEENQNAPSMPSKRRLIVKGNMPGRTFIDVKDKTRLIKRLEVSVKTPITLKISFHYVSDSAGHTTDRNPNDLTATIEVLNSIFTPQTNINFVEKARFFLNLKKDLGIGVNYNVDYVKGGYLKGHEFDLVTSKRDNSAHINIFFVWQNEFVSIYKKGQKPVTETGSALGYSVGGRDIMIQNWDGLVDDNGDGILDNTPIWQNGRVLAHEVGHVLGIGDITKMKKIFNPVSKTTEKVPANFNYIMGNGPFIPKNHANIMHAIAKQIVGK